MPSNRKVAKRYFAALSAHDLDAAVGLWAPGGIDRMVGQRELIAPGGVRAYFAELFEAFPDFTFEIVQLVDAGDVCTVRWRARATFAGPGRFQGFAANGACSRIEGCDVLTMSDGLITANVAYVDSGEVARQLGLLPASGSKAERRLAAAANARTRLRWLATGAEPEAIAAGVWVLRGGRPRTMNVYLIADEGGVTVFDAGIREMAAALVAACARLGGVKRVVLGHADADHRGAAGALDAPIYCHEGEREPAQLPSSFRDYWHLEKLKPWARPVYPSLIRAWDGGALRIEGTVAEGEEIAGFRVLHLPGHAPGLIGLYREEDRLALASDCLYTIDPNTSFKVPARAPHPAFTQDGARARASIRKLAALDPAVVWLGHADPITGDAAAKMQRAADAPEPA